MKFNIENSINDGYDTIIYIASSIDELKDSPFYEQLKTQSGIDNAIEKDGCCLAANHQFIKRLIYSPTGPINRDYDDVRRFGEAATQGIKRGIKAGTKAALISVKPANTFPYSLLVSILGLYLGIYVPLEIKEDPDKESQKLEKIGLIDIPSDAKVADIAYGLECGRIAARDIGGSDPERMAAPRVQQYVEEMFKSSSIKVDVISEDEVLLKEYPLFSAVNRCAKGVDRHKGRIIYLTYEGSGPITKTLLLVGKGVTYDTGGADIKAGGIMAGMHRDKCGSAAVAGFMQVLDKLRPPNIKVIGGMAMVRNSVGSNAYVSDEIFKSRAGVRVRVGNTDAEGRMAMADVLCRMKEIAQNEVNPYIMTIATLTGHVCLAYSESYCAVMDNGPAHQDKVANLIQDAGHDLGDPFEISRIRREDYEHHKGRDEYEDIIQCCNLPSSRTPRGHMAPAAFMIMASGMDKHGIDSDKPLPYSHLDIAGGSGPFPGVPTGAPVLALSKAFFPDIFEKMQ